MARNRRARETRSRARLLRQIGATRAPRRARLARQFRPKAIEREYQIKLRAIQKTLRIALKPLLDELPQLMRDARKARRVDADRVDIGESRRVRTLLELIRDRASLSTAALEDLATEFAQKIETHQRIQLGKQLKSTLGVEVFRDAPELRAVLDAWVTENVSLIKNMPQKTLGEIEGIVNRGISSGKLHKDIASDISARLAIGERRAALIARDQVGKFYGAVTEVRHKSIGVERFTWRTVADDRVRDVHAALDGQTFKWREPPGEGIPGQPINCRCYADPVLDDLLAGL